jgi:hypothetical protein
MAEVESIGEYMMEKFIQGVEELRNANIPEVQSPQVEAPQVEAAPQMSSYEMALESVAQTTPAVSMDIGMER